MKFIFKNKPFIILVTLFTINTYAMAQNGKSVNDVKGLPLGAKAPKFTTVDADGMKYKLEAALKKGPVVVLFYRGQWCPVCNRYLSQLQDSLQLVYKKGATVVAISPEKPELLNKTKEKTKATFTLLHDKDFLIGNAFDVVFIPEEKIIALYNDKLKANLEGASSDGSPLLPVPATFIINKAGVIVWRQFNPDYRVRASVKDIMKNIPAK